MQTRPFLLLLLVLILSPVAALAQTSGESISPLPRVRIDVEFVAASFLEVDNLGINFDVIPVAAQSAGISNITASTPDSGIVA